MQVHLQAFAQHCTVFCSCLAKAGAKVLPAAVGVLNWPLPEPAFALMSPVLLAKEACRLGMA